MIADCFDKAPKGAFLSVPHIGGTGRARPRVTSGHGSVNEAIFPDFAIVPKPTRALIIRIELH